MKELKKLKEEDTKSLKDKVAVLIVELAVRKDEIKELKKRVGILERIKEVVRTLGNILNKACLFDKDVKTERKVSAAKIIKVLVSFTRRMETALVDIWKIVFRSSAGKSSRPLMPPPTEIPRKEKPLEEIKTPLLRRPGKEAMMEESGEVPSAEFMTAKPVEALVVTLTPKVKKSESSEPSPRKEKKKERTPEIEELKDSMEEMSSSNEGTKSDEVEPASPQAEKKKSMNTRSSDKKKPPPFDKTPVASKQRATLQKGEGSLKKSKGK